MSYVLVLSRLIATFAQSNPLENLKTAFEVAEKELDIPQMLDPEGNGKGRKGEPLFDCASLF